MVLGFGTAMSQQTVKNHAFRSMGLVYTFIPERLKAPRLLQDKGF